LLAVAVHAEVVTSNPMEDPNTGLPVNVKGMYRTFHFNDKQWYMIFMWIFGAVWANEIVTAMGSFAISHAVVMKHFIDKKMWNAPHQCLPLSRGYINACMFHMGSIAFGAFVIGVLRIITAIMAYLSRQNDQKGGNVASKVACMACVCCLSCLTSLIELVNEMAYVEVVMNGRGYLSAAYHVAEVTLKNPITAVTTIGTVKAIKYTGLILVGGGGTLLTHWILIHPAVIQHFVNQSVSKLQQMPHADTLHLQNLGNNGTVASAFSDSLYTSNVMGMTIMCGIVIFTITYTFMNIFVSVAHTLAYINVTAEDQKQEDA